MAMTNQLLHTEHHDGDGNDVHACWACEMMFSLHTEETMVVMVMIFMPCIWGRRVCVWAA